MGKSRKERRAALAAAAVAAKPVDLLPRPPELDQALAAHAELAQQVNRSIVKAFGLGVVARTYDADGNLIGAAPLT